MRVVVRKTTRSKVREAKSEPTKTVPFESPPHDTEGADRAHPVLIEIRRSLMESRWGIMCPSFSPMSIDTARRVAALEETRRGVETLGIARPPSVHDAAGAMLLRA